MKRLVIAIVIAGAAWGGIVAVNAAPVQTIRTYQGIHESQYDIPTSGSYCFNASADLPADLPVCGVNPHQAVAPDPSVGPSWSCPPGNVLVVDPPGARGVFCVKSP